MRSVSVIVVAAETTAQTATFLGRVRQHCAEIVTQDGHRGLFDTVNYHKRDYITAAEAAAGGIHTHKPVLPLVLSVLSTTYLHCYQFVLEAVITLSEKERGWEERERTGWMDV